MIAGMGSVKLYLTLCRYLGAKISAVSSRIREVSKEISNQPYAIESSPKEWKAAGRKGTLTSVQIALDMRVGQVLRIYHPDTYCSGTTSDCGLRNALRRKPGRWRFRHLGQHTALVYREE